MLTLMINLAIIFVYIFDENDWSNFTRLNKIVNITFAYQFDEET